MHFETDCLKSLRITRGVCGQQVQPQTREGQRKGIVWTIPQREHLCLRKCLFMLLGNKV